VKRKPGPKKGENAMDDGLHEHEVQYIPDMGAETGFHDAGMQHIPFIGIEKSLEANKSRFSCNTPLLSIAKEVLTYKEIDCIGALCDLQNISEQKSNESFGPSQISCTDSDFPPRVGYSIPENQLVGTEIHVLLYTFVTRTRRGFDYLVDVSVIQRAVEMLPYLQLTKENGVVNCGKIPVDEACWTYFLACVRLGSLQMGHLEVGLQEKYCESLWLSIRARCGEERVEVILAHLLVAFFCISTKQTTSYKKHCGFAKALLESLSFSVPENVNKSFLVISYAYLSPSIPQNLIESGFLQMFLDKFSFDPETFRNIFPFFSAFMNSRFDSNFNSSHALDTQFAPALMVIFEGSLPAAMLLMTVRFFQKVLLSSTCTKQQILEALSEISKIFSFMLNAINSPIDSMAPLIQGYLLQVDFFKCLVAKDVQGASRLLSIVFCSLDFWMLRTGYLAFGEDLVHQLHFLIAAAAVLNMETEYLTFWGKIKVTWLLMERPLYIPEELHSISDCNPCSLCLCNEPTPECGIPCSAILNLCIAE